MGNDFDAATRVMPSDQLRELTEEMKRADTAAGELLEAPFADPAAFDDDAG